MKILLALAAVAGVTVLPPRGAELDLKPVLRALEEAPIEEWPETQAYRFVWIPHFSSERVVSVRVAETTHGVELVAKAAESGHVVERKKRELSAAEWEGLAAAGRDGFWNFQPKEYPEPVLDGGTWVLEGVSAGKRLRIVQQAPSPGPFLSLCQTIFKLAGMPLEDKKKPGPRRRTKTSR